MGDEPVDTSIDEGESHVDEILDSVTTASFSDPVSSPSTPPIDPFHSSDSEGSSTFNTLVVVVDLPHGGLSKLVRKYDTGICCPQSLCLGVSASNV